MLKEGMLLCFTEPQLKKKKISCLQVVVYVSESKLSLGSVEIKSGESMAS